MTFLFSPLVVLVAFSFNSSEALGLPFESFSLHWFRELFADAEAMAALRASLVVAAVVTPFSVVLGLVSAYAIARSPAQFRGSALGVYSVPLVVPWLVTGVAGLLFFNALGLQGSLATVSVMQIVVTFPLVTLILYARLAGMDVSVEEAGLDLGSGRVGVICRVVLPQLTTPIIVGAVFSCISSLGNFVVTFFVSGYTSTLPIWGYSELRHAENLPMVNASSTVMLAINVLLFVVLLFLSRRDREGVSAWF